MPTFRRYGCTRPKNWFTGESSTAAQKTRRYGRTNSHRRRTRPASYALPGAASPRMSDIRRDAPAARERRDACSYGLQLRTERLLAEEVRIDAPAGEETLVRPHLGHPPPVRDDD